MSEELMNAVAELIRDQRVVEQLERMAAGRLPPDELAELERRAADDPSLRAALALCRPPEPGFHDRLAQAARSSLGGPSPARRLRWRRSMTWWSSGAAVAAAAAALLLFVRGEAPADLPAYRLSIAGTSEYRAAQPAGRDLVELGAGGALELVLRPAVRVAEPVEAWFFAVDGDRVEPVSLALERDASGAMRATGTVGEWAARPILLVAIGRAGRAPAPADARARAAGWRWIEQPIRLRR
jgi:hypothetical protein